MNENEENNKPKLWNPNAVANWSLLFTPIFGSYLNIKNWEELEERDQINSAKNWFWVSIVLYVIFAVTALKYGAGIAFWYLVIWYFFGGRKQAKFVKNNIGSNYTRKAWGKPLLAATSLLLVYMFINGAIHSQISNTSPITTNSSTSNLSKEKPSEESYTNADTLDYRNAVLEEYKRGEQIKFVGEINQVIGDDSAMIQTEKLSIGRRYSGKPVILKFSSKPKIITDDIVKIYGRYSGTIEYETVLGQEKVDPLFEVDYYYVQ